MRSVTKSGERFQIAPPGRRQARVFSFMKTFFNLGPGG
jgi:hypothetical protein